MASFNKVVLIGRLTRNPELKTVSTASQLARFTIAINESYKSDGAWQTKCHFIPITVWGRQADACFERLTKGSQVLVEGKLNHQTWVESGSGQKRSTIDVTATYVTFLDGRRSATTGRDNDRDEAYESRPNNDTASNDDDVPF